jgi:hypothetical protein
MTAEGCSKCGALEPELPDRADGCVESATEENRAEKHDFGARLSGSNQTSDADRPPSTARVGG